MTPLVPILSPVAITIGAVWVAIQIYEWAKAKSRPLKVSLWQWSYLHMPAMEKVLKSLDTSFMEEAELTGNVDVSALSTSAVYGLQRNARELVRGISHSVGFAEKNCESLLRASICNSGTKTLEKVHLVVPTAMAVVSQFNSQRQELAGPFDKGIQVGDLAPGHRIDLWIWERWRGDTAETTACHSHGLASISVEMLVPEKSIAGFLHRRSKRVTWAVCAVAVLLGVLYYVQGR